MAAIDPNDVLADVKIYLPTSNVLNDTELLGIINFVIANLIPLDDTVNQPEATCKSLRNAAIVNQSRYSVDETGKKREKVGTVEIEFFDGTSKEVWSGFLNNLQNLCPLILGYTGLASNNTFTINPGDRFVISPCNCIDPCDCASEQLAIYEEEFCNPRFDGDTSTTDPFQ